jgi:hypothetical protein
METITTSITNLDIHDIARTAITYQLEKYYVIHPLPTQHQLIQEIIDYWQSGYGAQYNPDRKKALEIVELQNSIADVKAVIAEKYGAEPYTVVTDARTYPNTVSYHDLREKIFAEGSAGETSTHNQERDFLLLFGTGWGMIKEVMESADFVLEPIYGRGDYNHLCVRSAVAIILDRLMGETWWK